VNQVLLAAGIFLVTYALIVVDRIHRTIAALLGGLAVIVLGIVPQHEAFAAIDWNVIFLLAGMMIIASILSETGLFQWIAVRAVKLGRGNPMTILLLLVLITAFGSALLDNVTVIVLIAPVTLFVASSLGVNPLPYLLAETMASNIGGIATLIGDPPNILIASAAGLDFMTFAANMAPIMLIILAAFCGLSFLLFRKDVEGSQNPRLDVQALDTSELITDPIKLRKSLVVLVGVLIGFLFQGMLHLEPATIAMTGATLLLLWSGSDPHTVLRDVEWTTLFFFIGLFVVVEAVVAVGLIDQIARGAVQLTGGSLRLTSTLILWLSAVASGIVDNIPYTAAMIPIVESVGKTMPVQPLWWSLTLGADLGGNLTLVGASANIIAASLAERSGHPIKFRQWLRYGIPVTFVALCLANIYIALRYW
jgi:Na+/H+ antiporter NhaD/arsenite permease-like protein